MPEPFSTVIGHDAVLALLRSELEAPSQAYLFVGPSNVGKASVAREFASELIAEGDEGIVRRAREGNHPDCIVVAPEGRTSITVDQARMIVSGAVRSPLEADTKVFLLEEASMLNDEAANALLKSIEEPIASTRFVLVADSEDDLPATVASRCRTIVFGRVMEEEIVAGLVRQGIEPDQAARAARISGGRPGLAVALATEPQVATFRQAWLDVPDGLTGHPGDAYLQVQRVLDATEPLLAAVKRRQEAEIEAAHPDGSVPKSVVDRHQRELGRSSDALYGTGLELLASLYRDVAAAQFGAPIQNSDVGVGALTRVVPSTAVANAERVMDAIDALKANQRPQLALAALFVDLATDG